MPENKRFRDIRKTYLDLGVRTSRDPMGLLIKNHVPFPESLGIIMDGNGRWAEHHGLSIPQGHIAGAKRMADIFRSCYQLSIKTIVVWAMSPDNFERRDSKEILGLMDLTLQYLKNLLPQFEENEVCFVHLGRKEGLPSNVASAIEAAELATAKNTRQKIALALNYGGDFALFDSMREAIAHESQTSTDEALAPYLDYYGIGQLEMLVRTGGDLRLSGIGWIADRAELFFPKTLMPDFTVRDLALAFLDYSFREIRRGGRPAKNVHQV